MLVGHFCAGANEAITQPASLILPWIPYCNPYLTPPTETPGNSYCQGFLFSHCRHSSSCLVPSTRYLVKNNIYILLYSVSKRYRFDILELCLNFAYGPDTAYPIRIPDRTPDGIPDGIPKLSDWTLWFARNPFPCLLLLPVFLLPICGAPGIDPGRL